jgi:hypothetical protein
MRKPLKVFCKDENISPRKAYDEFYAGRLVFTKVGHRVFIDDEDGARWRDLAPKVTGKAGAGELVLQAARQAVENLGRAVDRGLVERRVAATAMRELTAGLNRAATA